VKIVLDDVLGARMFTGIVEEIGHVLSLERMEVELWDGSRGLALVLVVSCGDVLDGCSLGCSIAVNGTCLTVTSFTATTFTTHVAPETEDRTNLGSLRPGSRVNLERSLALGARNSGHYVQGHIDGTGVVVARWQEGSALWFRLRADKGILDGIVLKGYVALDGTSLTVCEVDRTAFIAGVTSADSTASTFTIMLVPHSQQHVVFPDRAVGDDVNIEVDVLGKYVAHAEDKVPGSEVRWAIAAGAIAGAFAGATAAACIHYALLRSSASKST
jgi:riboflavin synthase